MVTQKLTVVVKFKAKSGLEGEVREELLSLIEPTRKETGYISYDLHQSQEDKSVFLLYENWVSKKDYGNHLRSPHIEVFFGKIGELLAEPIEIKFYDTIISEKAV